MSQTQRILARYLKKKQVTTEKGDKQVVYEYSDRHISERQREKAARYEKLKKSLASLRSKVKRDLRSDDPEKMLTALAVGLLDATFERIGNEESAKDGHVGVTGWQRKHISFSSSGASIKYTGKSGVKHVKKVQDATLKKALRDAYEALSDDDDDLLSYEGGKITAEKVNAYLEPFDITAKDIRGFHANDEMTKKLKEVRKGALPEDKKERKEQLKEEFKKALEETAELVGHEAKTLESDYLVPGLKEEFLKTGEVSASFLKTAAVERIVARFRAG